MDSKKPRHKLKTLFVTGIFALLPLTITYLILGFIFKKLDAFSQPLITGILKFFELVPPEVDYIPGLGLVVTVLVILGTGLLMTNIVGKRLLVKVEGLLQKIPLVSNIYHSSKQLLDSVTVSKSSLLSVVLVEFPRKGMYSVGFVTSVPQGDIRDIVAHDVITVLIPTTPNPTTGFLCMVSRKETVPLTMTVEEGVKLVMSCGLIPPPVNLLNKDKAANADIM